MKFSFILTPWRLLKALWRALKDPDFSGLLFLVLIILSAGTVFYHNIEGWNWLDSAYFSVATLSTVGYGDLTPTTPISKVFTMAFILVGVGLLLAFITKIADHVQHDDVFHFWRRKKKEGKDESS